MSSETNWFEGEQRPRLIWPSLLWLAGIIVAIIVALILSGCATPQERMKYCNEQAVGMKGDQRKAFMSECLKAHFEVDGKIRF